MTTRKPNPWNLYQHLRKLAKSDKGTDKWAFNWFQGMLDRDKLDKYSQHFIQD